MATSKMKLKLDFDTSDVDKQAKYTARLLKKVKKAIKKLNKMNINVSIKHVKKENA